MVKSVKNSKTTAQKTRAVKNTVKKQPKREPVVMDSKKYTNMFDAYRAFWKRGFTEWAGTSSRSEYWWATLVNALILLGLFALYMWTGTNITFGTFGGATVLLFMLSAAVIILYGLATIVPSVSITVRRLHDAGLSTWWIVLYPMRLLPYIGWVAFIVLFVMMLLPTKTECNPYHKFNK